MKGLQKYWAGFVSGCALATAWGWVDLMQAQDVYLKGFPEARQHVDYSLWAVNERAGFRAEFAGEADQACQPGIVVRRASEAEWDAAGAEPYWQAFTSTCPMLGAYQVVWKPGLTPTRSLMLHELGGHAMGCWDHMPVTGLDTFLGSRHVLAPTTPAWTAFTAEDVDCIVKGAFWPVLSSQRNTCFIELTPEFDLIAPDAMGHYTRLRFVGSVKEGRHEWMLDRRAAGKGNCASVRVQGGQIVLDDVRSQEWQGSAVIAPSGNLWRLVAAIPR